MEFIYNHRDVIAIVAIFLVYVLTFYVGSEKGKAKKENDVYNAALYETLERVLVGLLIVLFLKMLLLDNQDIMATGFSKVLSKLEALKNG